MCDTARLQSTLLFALLSPLTLRPMLQMRDQQHVDTPPRQLPTPRCCHSVRPFHVPIGRHIYKPGAHVGWMVMDVSTSIAHVYSDIPLVWVFAMVRPYLWKHTGCGMPTTTTMLPAHAKLPPFVRAHVHFKLEQIVCAVEATAEIAG
jgi:hypothetical protein